MKKQALIAMSGGVDSAVAAYLTQQQGLDCIGITMRLFSNEDVGITGQEEQNKGQIWQVNQKTCCSLEDANLAEKVADRLDIPFYVFNLAEDFKKQVIGRFIASYENGATPNPCIDCNRFIKFDRLFLRAKQLGLDYVVTGHYARIEQNGSRFLLKKGVDSSKDQSYVLYAMTQEQLGHTLFPLGGLKKSEVREIAAKHGFVNAEKPESQDICFVRDGDYARFIEYHTGKQYQPGNFLDLQGNVLGQHNGLIRYTIGQRKGLGIALGKPMYVCEKRPNDNTVVLCENEKLFQKELYANDFNWIAEDTPSNPIRIKAKIRYNQSEQWATAESIAQDTVRIVFDEPQRAIAAGQAVVLYDGDIVVGGGTILKVS